MTIEMYDSDILVKLAAEGDASARDRLFSRHRDRLKHMVRVRMDPRIAGRVDPSDVVQEVMFEASERFADYARTREIPFYPWLRQLAWDKVVEVHRWHFRKKRTVDREVPGGMSLSDDSICDLAEQLVYAKGSPSASVLRRELIDRVRAAMDHLEPIDREILTLRHLERLSTHETAAVVGISVSAAKSRHFRAMQRLLAKLDSEFRHHE